MTGLNKKVEKVIKTTTYLLIFFSLLAVIVTDVRANPVPTWLTEAALPVTRADATAVTYNNMLYVFGGYQTSDTGQTSTVYAYSPATNTWTQEASMNSATWGSAAAVYNGVAYVFGGIDGVKNTKVQAYNFAGNSWTTRNNLPSNLAGQGEMAVTAGSLIYVFGGWSGTSAYSYNPSTDTYTQLANIPYSTRWGTCAYVNVNGQDEIYLMGGWDNKTGSVNTTYFYTPTNNSWTYAGTTPYPAYGGLRDDPVINGLIYFGYGQDNGIYYNRLYSYNPNTATWSSALPNGTYPRDGVACGVISGKLYVVGGRNSSASSDIQGLNYNEQFNPANAMPVNISPGQVTMCLGQSQKFTSSVSGGTKPFSYQWYLNGGAVSGATSSTWTFTPNQAGDYSVYLSVTDSLNNDAQSNTVNNVLVYNQLSNSINPASVNYLKLGGSQQFTSVVMGGVQPYSYQWYLNGGAVSGATSSTWTFTPNQAGDYSVYLSVTDSLNNDAQSNTVNNVLVYNQLSNSINPASVNYLKLGGSQQFTSVVMGGVQPYSYQWYLNGGAVSGATSSTWTFTSSATGTYNIYLKASDGNGTLAQSDTTTINVPLPVSVTINSTQNKISLGQSQTLTSLVSGGVAPYLYQWVSNGTEVSGATSSTWTFTPAQAGSYSVYLSVTDSLNKNIQSNTINEYQLTFGQSGLDSSSSGTVVTVDGAAKSFGDLPFSEWVESGASVTYSYSSIVSSGISGEQFVFTNPSGSISPITVASPVTVIGSWKTQYQITFMQSGLDTSVKGTIVTVDGSAKAFADLPFSEWVDCGSSVTYNYSSTVASGISGEQFTLNPLGTLSSSSIIMSAPKTAVANYKTQYLIVVASAHGNLPASDWVDASGNFTVSVTSPADTVQDGHQWVCTGFSVDGGVDRTGTTYAVINVQTTHMVEFAWKEQFWVTFDQKGVSNSIPINARIGSVNCTLPFSGPGLTKVPP